MAPKKKTESADEKPSTMIPDISRQQLKGRIIVPMQSAGRLGKSTFVDALLGWLDHAGVASRVVDCDVQHRTTSRRYGGEPFDLNGPEAIPALIDDIAEAEPTPVLALDFPAQATDRVLSEFVTHEAVDVLEDAGLRITVPLFLVEDAAALESLSKVVKTLGNGADYVLIRNIARGAYERVEESPMIGRLKDQGARVITLPAITTMTLKAIEEAAYSSGEYLTMAKAEAKLERRAKRELGGWLAAVWADMEDAASVLLPSTGLIKTPVSRLRLERRSAAFLNGGEVDPLKSMRPLE